MDRAKQVRIHELSKHLERTPTTVSQLLTQIQDFTEQSEFLSRLEGLLRCWCSEQLWSDPRSQSTLYSSESQNHSSLRLWIAAWDTERVLQETFFNDHLLKKDDLLHSSTIQRIWQPLLTHWDLTLQDIQSDRKGKWDKDRRSRQYLVELILTLVWLIIRFFRFRNCIL